MLEPVMFTGGLYKHDLVVELVEDLGGYVLQKNVTQTEIILLILVPSEDMAALQTLAKEQQFVAYRHCSFWQPMDTMRDKGLLDELWKSGKAPWKVWPSNGH